MSRISRLAAICFMLAPLFANAQEMPERPQPDGRDIDWSDIEAKAAVAVLGAIMGATIGAFMTSRINRASSRRQVLRELQKEFVYGDMLRPRLRAELLLFYDAEGKFKDKNFEDFYKGAMTLDEYADVAAVLNLFRLLDDYKTAGHIDEAEARKAFGWIYRWWWEKVIEPHSKGLEDDPNWKPHVARRDWLLQIEAPPLSTRRA